MAVAGGTNFGVYLECTICTLDYGLVTERIPRVLNCGHTFCHSCLRQCLRNDAIKCPYCSVITQVLFSEIANIPVNYGILDMLGVNKSNTQADAEKDTCEACEVAPATIICVSCSPIGFKFCSACDKKEHDRSFRPVQLHHRIPLQDYDFNILCSRHNGSNATHYSEKLNQFACLQCQSESDWATKSSHFLQLSDAAEQLRKKASKVNYRCTGTMRLLHDTHRNLDTTLLKLSESASEAKLSITNEFRKLIDTLEARQKRLIKHVEEEYSSRKESLEKQKSQIVEKSQLLSGHHDQLKNLLQKPNQSFLRGYPHIVENLTPYIVKEDKSIFRTIAPGDIPCFFRTNIQEDLKQHGAVGGGPVPQNIICQRVPLQQSTLPQLSWSLPEYSTDIVQYEVEYEHIPDERPPSPIDGGSLEVLSQPNIVAKSGKAQAHIMNSLVPGYRYQFRVRSRSVAGWGMWSDPITGRFDGLPVRISFTGEKVSICVPAAGEYRITAAGAKAADGNKFKGGRGAVISAVFGFKKYDCIEVAVGGMSQKGTEGHSGGAGGTFVLLYSGGDVKVSTNLLIAAGGGGGTRGYDDHDEDGADASLEKEGTDGRGKEHGLGGREGLAGTDANYSWFQGFCWGYGGAGFLQSSSSAKCYVEGLEGGQCGGYGGGGGVGHLGGGGGGGYSGGGGGRGGGGGGSYVKDTAVEVTKRVGNCGNGYVLIERVDNIVSDPLINMARKENKISTEENNHHRHSPSGTTSPNGVSPNNTRDLT